MKRIIYMCLLILLALPTWSPAAVIGPARISYVDGDILFRSPDTDEWLPVVINTPLDEGDAIWCPDGSRVEIQLPDGSIVRLDGGTQLDLLANEDGFLHLHLASGHLYLRTAQASKDNALQIDADDTTVLPSGRTRLRIDMLPNSLEDVAITKGSAYVEGSGNRTRVRAGEHIMLEEGHSEVLTLNPADEWELWNVDRDRAQSRSARADSYLPDELRGYSAEMDTNGTWEYVPEYGRVWRPTVMVTDDWAPYRSGRWVWKGDDYVWLSFESWGWVPYHFGRWAVVSGFGWCWVPPARGDVYWGPGYVGWYHTGNQVGWTPLAPGEVFYGHRNYGRHSVNITNVTVNTNTVVYRNRTSRGGLTVVAHDDFLRGRTVVQQPARNANVSVAVSVGSPRIRPLRETRMPIVKQTPPRVAPPRIEQRDNRDLRTRFPRVTPEATGERRRQQAAPAAAVPPTTSRPTPQTREKKTVFPVITPPGPASTPDRQPSQTPTTQREDRRQPSSPTTPASPPQQGDRQQRDERRQPSTPTPAVTQPPRTAPPASPPQQPDRQQREDRRQGDRPPQVPAQAVPPLTQGQPPASPGAPQRADQPRRTPATPDAQNRPAAPPPRGDVRQPATTAAPVAPPSRPVAAPRAEPPRKETAPKDVQQKKVWKVTTPESTNEKDNGGKDTRGKEHRER